jgi:hypothetical protein
VTAFPDDAAEVITLWPDGPPTRIENVPPEVAYEVHAGVAAGTTLLRNISEPTLTVFTPPGAANGVGVIVVPGGGWTISAWTHEGLEVARWLTALGYTAFVPKRVAIGQTNALRLASEPEGLTLANRHNDWARHANDSCLQITRRLAAAEVDSKSTT